MRKRIAILLTGMFAVMALLAWLRWGALKSSPADRLAGMPAHVAAREKSGQDIVSSAASGTGSAAATGPESPKTPRKLLGDLIFTEGVALDTSSTAYITARLQGRIPVGQVGTFAPAVAGELGRLEKGQQVTLTLPGGAELPGIVNLVLHGKDGIVRVGGGIVGKMGSFSLNQGVHGFGGRVVLQDEARAYVLASVETGRVQMREMALSDVMCYPMSKPTDPSADNTALQPSAGPAASIPELRSRPGAAAVLYLDFDGETVTDPDWNNGITIVAAPAPAGPGQITETWARVVEDFVPFNINVTTVLSDYQAAAVGRRMRVIITPTDTAMPGAGGVAYIDTFAGSSDLGFNSDVPCWAFTSSGYVYPKNLAELVSHELGHTFGLAHDGRQSPAEEYYYGHGFNSTAWAPIMGSGYYGSITQWSKGEYPRANNQEDDIAIIAGTAPTTLSQQEGYGPIRHNQTGFVPDDVGNTALAATAVDVSTGWAYPPPGIISSQSDSDFYSFTLTAPKEVSLGVFPADSYDGLGNLDARLELHDGSGTVLAVSDSRESKAAQLLYTLGVGTYYCKVQGAGRAADTYELSDHGYSAYGSIGQYRLNFYLVNLVPPVINSHPNNVSMLASQTAGFSVSVTGSAGTQYRWQRLPAGGGGWADLADGGAYANTGAANLSVVTTLGMNGDQFRCLVSNPAGSVTSNAAILTVSPLPPPHIAMHPASTAVALGGGASLNVFVDGFGVTYQWYRNGQPITGATGQALTISNAGLTDYGEYFMAATNATGTVLSRTATVQFMEPDTAPAGRWLDMKAVDGVAYFLFADTPRIERYDMVGETWLAPWPLPETPKAFAIAASAIYVGYGNNVWKYTRAFTGGAQFITGTDPVIGLLDAGVYIVVINGSIYGFSSANSHSATEGLLIASTSNYYRTGIGFSYDAESGRVYGRTSGSYPGDIGRYHLHTDGTWLLTDGWNPYQDSPYHGSMPDAKRTYVIGGDRVVDNSGTVYRGSDLTLAGAFGGAFSDIILDGVGGFYVLRGRMISAANAAYAETTVASLDIDAGRVARHGSALYCFATPVSVGGQPVLQKVAVSQLQAPAVAATVSPVGRTVWSPQVVQGEDDQVYVYSKIDRNIFVWSVESWSYQPSIPVTGSSDTFVAGPGNRLYYTRWGTQIRSVSAEGTDSAFVSAIHPVIAMQGLGAYLLYCDYVYNGLAHKIVSDAGALTYSGGAYSTREFAWNPIYGRLFQFRENSVPGDLLSTETLPGGKLGDAMDSPYHGEIATNYPLRVSPDGLRVVLGSGQIVDSATMNISVTLPHGLVDAAWAGGRLQTVRAVGSVTELSSWSETTFESMGSTTFSGRPVRLLALKSDRLLLITTDENGVLSYRMLASGDRSLVDPTVDMAPVIDSAPADRVLPVGSAQSFHVITKGGPLPSYQWQMLLPGGAWQDVTDNDIFRGGQTARLDILNVPAEFAGAQLRIVVTNTAGSVVSTPAVVGVNGPAAVVGVAAGGSSTFFWRADGSLWASGFNSTGQLGDGTTITRTAFSSVATNVVQASVGGGHSLIVKADGTLWGAGNNFGGQLGDGTTTSRTTFAQVASGVLHASAGDTHSLFLKADGSLWGIGGNYYGALGDGTDTSRSTPVLVDTNVVFCTGGYGTSYYIKNDGTLWATGLNVSGMLGVGTYNVYNYSWPQLVASNVKSVASLRYHALFLKDDGSLWGMGSGSSGALGPDATSGTAAPVQIATEVSQIGAGQDYTLFIKTDGTLWGMGINNVGQLGTGNFDSPRLAPVMIASGVRTIATGELHSLFTKSDGSVWGTGSSSSGQLGRESWQAFKKFFRINIGLWGSVPPAPTGLTASDGTKSSGVLLSWQRVLGATGYQVWRSTANDSATASLLRTGLTVPLFSDRTADTGVTYYYWLKAENSLGSSPFSDGDAGVRAAGAAPIIALDPHSQTADLYKTAAFVVEVISEPTASYQWQVKYPGLGTDWVNFSSWSSDPGTGRMLSVVADYDNHGAQYRCVVTNPLGSVISEPAALTMVVPPPVINGLSQDTDVVLGSSLWVHVSAYSPVPVTYQWRKNGVDVPGAVSSVYYVAAVQSSDFAEYSVVITNEAGTVTSDTVMVYILIPPSITSHPQPQVTLIGGGANFSVQGTGIPAPTYQWQRQAAGLGDWVGVANGGAYSGAATTSLTVAGTTADMNGDKFRCVVTNHLASVTSNAATLTVNKSVPVITWSMPAAIPYGTPLGVTQLNATATIPGTFVYSPAAGAMLSAGTHTLNVTFTPTDTTHYSSATAQQTLVINSVGGQTEKQPLVDLDGDGQADLIWHNPLTGEYATWLMAGTAIVDSMSYGLPAEWEIAGAADFNGDGQADLLWRNAITGGIVLWEMNGTAIAGSAWIYDSGLTWRPEQVADFNGDGQADILWYNTINGDYAFWLMEGSLVIGASGFNVASGWEIATVSDFSGDGQADILWRHGATGGMVMWTMNGMTMASSAWVYNSGTGLQPIWYADFNGDGKADILWRDTNSGDYGLWLMNGGSILNSVAYGVGADWVVAAAADFSGDGKADLLWRNVNTGGIVMWEMDGTAIAGSAWIYDSGLAWRPEQIGDFNGDGQADILWYNTINGDYAFWLMDGPTVTQASGFNLPNGWTLDK